MATDPTSVPAGVRNTLTLLARIHAELDGAAQTTVATRPSLTGHAAPALGARKVAQQGMRTQSHSALREAS